jgi:hypothetical protein
MRRADSGRFQTSPLPNKRVTQRVVDLLRNSTVLIPAETHQDEALLHDHLPPRGIPTRMRTNLLIYRSSFRHWEPGDRVITFLHGMPGMPGDSHLFGY